MKDARRDRQIEREKERERREVEKRRCTSLAPA